MNRNRRNPTVPAFATVFLILASGCSSQKNDNLDTADQAPPPTGRRGRLGRKRFSGSELEQQREDVPQRATPNVNTVRERYVAPGRRIVDGKFA